MSKNLIVVVINTIIPRLTNYLYFIMMNMDIINHLLLVVL